MSELSDDARLAGLTRASGKTARGGEFRHVGRVDRAKKGKKREVTAEGGERSPRLFAGIGDGDLR